MGDVIHIISPDPAAAGNFCSIGLAFDGASLYFDRCSDPLIYEISPLDGSMISSFNPGITELPNAMAFDVKRNGLWIGAQACNGTGMPIHFWDFDDNSVTLMFTVPFALVNPATGSNFVAFCFIDGLAYNENDPTTDADDQIWLSDDVNRNIGLFRPNGTLVNGFDATSVDASLASCSGLAVGGQNLYLANDGGGDVFRADITTDPLALVDQFVSGDVRQEDMECDPVTFAPIEVMWVRTTPQGVAADDVITAYEIEPGTCGLGGGGPEPFVKFSQAPLGACACACDVDLDGVCTIGGDLAAVVDCVGGDCSRCVSSCDVNCDGVVDVDDADAIACLFGGTPPEVCCPADEGEDIPSNIDWVDAIPNIVAADDFISDGRPINGVRWWGSDLRACLKPAPAADDCWNTQCGGGTSVDFGGGTIPTIPVGFFGPGSDPFSGIVELGGTSGFIDTVISRLNDMCLEGSPPVTAQTPIEIVQLNLSSCTPITVTFDGGQNPQLWDVQVFLDGPQPQGTLTARKLNVLGGTYDTNLPVRAGFQFTEVGGPGGPFILSADDIGGALSLSSTGLPWVQDPPPIGLFCGNGGFFPGMDKGDDTCCPESCHAGPAPGHDHCVIPPECPRCNTKTCDTPGVCAPCGTGGPDCFCGFLIDGTTACVDLSTAFNFPCVNDFECDALIQPGSKCVFDPCLSPFEFCALNCPGLPPSASQARSGEGAAGVRVASEDLRADLVVAQLDYAAEAAGSFGRPLRTLTPARLRERADHRPQRPDLHAGENNRVPGNRAAGPGTLPTQDLNAGLTPTDLVNTLLGAGVTVSNVVFTGDNSAAGAFSGGTGIIGFESGVILSSGNVAFVAGPDNLADGTTQDNGLAGDADLDALIPGFSTFDATVLEFDFECTGVQTIQFQYVFTSEEYNEFVFDIFNDVFGFFLNGTNIALVPGGGNTPVAINNVNCDNPFNPPSGNNCNLYRNNDCDDIAPNTFPCTNIQTEMDGLTLVFTATGTLNPGVNHIKLAIADAGDAVLDSNVFIKAESFSCTLPTGACCDTGAFTCQNNVLEASCQGPDDVWSVGLLCSDLDPPCVVPDPDGWFISFHEPVITSRGSRRGGSDAHARAVSVRPVPDDDQMWLRADGRSRGVSDAAGELDDAGPAAPASPADFQWDDGSAEDSVGVNDGATGTTFGWANQFQNNSGSPILLTEIEVAFGVAGGATGVSIGDAVDGVVWIDAAATGNMVNATMAVRWSLPGGVHANDGATFATHVIPGGGVAIPAGAEFYVGLGDIQTEIDSVMRFPAAIDQSSPSALRSWAFFGPAVFDPVNLAGQSIGVIDGFGIPGNWLVRANATAAQQAPLALYYCDAEIVRRTSTALPACDLHPVKEYRVDLTDCCLVHANVDSRSGTMPATKDAFFEEKCLDYAIDIQAVIGHEFIQDPVTLACIEVQTGRSAVQDFWGWHTTSKEVGAFMGLRQAVSTSIKMAGPDWLYGPWNAVVPICSQPNMAFELLTDTPPDGNPDENSNGVPDQCEPMPPDPPLPEVPGNGKNRYISFVATNPGVQTALRVTLASSTLFPGEVGDQWWVTAPQPVCQNSGQNSDPPPPPPGCGPTGGLLPRALTAAELTCIPSPPNPPTSPHCQDWGAVGLVHVSSEHITPGAVYNVQAVVCTSDLTNEANFSAPLPVSTSKRWVDVCGTGPAGACAGPPDGIVDVQDEVGIIDSFKNNSFSLLKPRVDLSSTNQTLDDVDREVSVGEFVNFIDAFGGAAFPFTGPSACP